MDRLPIGVPEFTVVVALDERHHDQFRAVWPTWIGVHPILRQLPLLVICDCYEWDSAKWRLRLNWLDHPRLDFAFWDWPRGETGDFRSVTQRERMLTAFVRVPPIQVVTDYWLKLDTDVVAIPDRKPWPDAGWFYNCSITRHVDYRPVLIASPWAYTKPPEWIETLQEWADEHEHFYNSGHRKRLAIPPPAAGAETIPYPRIISWCCFVHTIWSKLANGLCPHPNRLPVPSQDTYHWYVAARRCDPIVRVRMKDYGWQQTTGRGLRETLIRMYYDWAAKKRRGAA